ncbi:MAG: S8 family serine peptidase, partial [Acidimicrobiaceae bacterium]|nr:S8 family serine peptidase [Acidimicrobiaceae bacterium]MYJ42255.1 S8 family serine peptidase [Acidimicrobiaceae bacterium]
MERRAGGRVPRGQRDLPQPGVGSGLDRQRLPHRHRARPGVAGTGQRLGHPGGRGDFQPELVQRSNPELAVRPTVEHAPTPPSLRRPAERSCRGVGTWRRLAAMAAVLASAAAVLHPGGAGAQTLPGRPQIREIAAGSGTLTVFWDAPADTGGETVTAYDLRWIDASSADRSDSAWTLEDSFWTSGALTGDVAGLTNGTTYDVQMRAVTAVGDGAWSQQASAAPLISAPAATVVAGDGAATVAWTPPPEAATAASVDYDVRWIRSDASDKSDSRWSRASDVGADPPHHVIRGLSNTFSYDVQVRAVTDHDGSWSATVRATPYEPANLAVASLPEIAVGVPVAGRLTTGDVDVFRLVLEQHDRYLVRTSGSVDDTACLVLNAGGGLLAGDSDGNLGTTTEQRSQCALMFTPAAGGGYPRYVYIRVAGDRDRHAGEYLLHIESVQQPGGSLPTAVPISFGGIKGGEHTSSERTGHVRIDLSEAQYIAFSAIHAAGEPQLTLLDSSGTEMRAYVGPLWVCALVFCIPVGTDLKAVLEAGTYYVRLEPPEARPGRTNVYGAYLFTLQVDAAYRDLIEDCSAKSRPAAFTDALSGCQWHLHNRAQSGGTSGEDANVAAAHSAGHLGAGTTIAVVDGGIDLDHEDLSDNTDTSRSHSYCSGDSRPFSPDEDHGTSSAGVAAARDNAFGMRGVAPRAALYNLRLIECGATYIDLAAAMTRDMAGIDVSSNSWSLAPSPAAKPVSALWEAAVEQGVVSGAGGKGIVYVTSAGNDAARGDYANLDETDNHYAVVTVCAVDANGRRSVYSEQGPNLWVCAPSSSTTSTPRVATTTNYDRYRTGYGGTSASTPTVSGVAALVRGANPSLTWRDVKLILAASARRNHASDGGWQQGAREYRSSTDRYWFNNDYGFGAVDAHAAVQLALGWQNVPAMITQTAASTSALAVPDNRSAVSASVTFDDSIEFVEHVEINTHFYAPSFRQLRVELVSPSGATSLLVPELASSFHRRLTSRFRMGSSRHLGESAAGDWTLRVSDRRAGAAPATLRSWSLTLRGHRLRPSAPTLDSLSAGASSLTLTWSPPAHTGASAVNGYEVRRIAASATDRSDSAWTVEAVTWQPGEALTHTFSGLAPQAWDVQVRATNSEGAGTWSAAAAGTVDAINNDPLFATDAATRAVAENTAAGVDFGDPVTAADADAGAALTYQLDGVNAGDFSIDSSTGQLATLTALDHETQPSYSVRVGVSDGLDSLGAADTAVDDWIDVTVAVSDVDEPFSLQCTADNLDGSSWALAEPDDPTQYDSKDPTTQAALRVGGCNVSDPEGEPASWSLSGDDAAEFWMDGLGVLGFLRAPDFESPASGAGTNTYTVTVGAAAGGHSQSTGITVVVTDKNEPPTISGDRAPAIDEGAGRTVGAYTAADPEGETTTLQLSNTLDASDFDLAADGTLSFTAVPDYETPGDSGRDNVYTLTLEAGDGASTTRETVTVTVRDVDEAPELSDGGCTFTTQENAASAWRCTFTASDPEQAPVTWSLSGPDAQEFSLNAGVLSIGGGLDYETRSSYSATVEATDGAHTVTQDVTVAVTNVDEPGTVTVPQNSVARVGGLLTAQLTDDDGASSVSWQWQRRSSGWQDVTGATSASYTPTGTDEGLRLRVNVSYTDTSFGDKTLTSAATAAVAAETPANQAPVFAATDYDCTVREDRRIGAAVTGCAPKAADPDNDSLLYSIDANTPLNINSATGRISIADALDHETDPQIQFDVVASDGLLEDRTSVTVTVTDIDEPGSVTVTVGGALRVGTSLDATLADDDCGHSSCDVQWDWQNSNNGRAWTTSASNTTGTYTLDTADECRQVRVRAVYTDPHGNKTVTGRPGPAGQLVQPATGRCATTPPPPPPPGPPPPPPPG